MILTELSLLADQVVGDVFESFSKHPKEIKQREQAEQARAGNSLSPQSLRAQLK